ncbi:MAG: hypothetical protein KBA64_01205 [Armatimonadetes bacterium]|nr:hypothetical protein [Armatimonadota bacterium]MDI9602299.1 hypothetical protein [Acidobacteriota bacterium]NLN89243.1 hypothetical protein [candidate division WS1 bacterium]
MPARDASMPPARRLAGCLTYLIAGALLVMSASRALDWWEQREALQSGASDVVHSEYDDSGNEIGQTRIPVDEAAARDSLMTALVLGVAGLIALAVGVVLQGLPWRALAPAYHGGSGSTDEEDRSMS